MSHPRPAGANLRSPKEQPGRTQPGVKPQVAQDHLNGLRNLSLPAGPVACGVESQEGQEQEKRLEGAAGPGLGQGSSCICSASLRAWTESLPPL